MDKYLKIILSNTLKHEAEHILENEDDINLKITRLNTIFNLKKIIDNYDELEVVLRKFFNEKAEKEKWEEER